MNWCMDIKGEENRPFSLHVCQISGGHRVQFALLPSKHSPAPQLVPEIFQFLIDTRVKNTKAPINTIT